MVRDEEENEKEEQAEEGESSEAAGAAAAAGDGGGISDCWAVGVPRREWAGEGKGSNCTCAEEAGGSGNRLQASLPLGQKKNDIGSVLWEFDFGGAGGEWRKLFLGGWHWQLFFKKSC